MHSVYVQGIPTKNMPFICATGFRQSRGSWRRVEAGDPRVGMDGLNNMLGKPPYRKLGNLHKENKPSIPNKPHYFLVPHDLGNLHTENWDKQCEISAAWELFFWVWTWDIHPQAMAFWEWTLWLACGILWMWDTPNLKTHPCHRISESVFSCDLYTSVAMHEASWNNLLVAIRDHIYTDWGLNPQNSACRISHTAWNAVEQ